MKKNITAIGIAIITTITLISSCNKDSQETISEAVSGTTALSNAKKNSEANEFSPHFKYRTTNSPLLPCTAKTGFFCGFDIDAVLNGDEACWLMMKDNDPYQFYLPKTILLSNNVGVLIDSARTGSMTFHSDFEVISAHLAKDLGISLIPAGRYPASMTTYDGDSAVCISLDTIL